MSQQQRDHHNLIQSHTKDHDNNSTNTVNQNQKALTKQATYMYHHLDNGEVEFSTHEIIPNQYTTINNKSQVTVTPISLGEITLQWCGVAK